MCEHRMPLEERGRERTGDVRGFTRSIGSRPVFASMLEVWVLTVFTLRPRRAEDLAVRPARAQLSEDAPLGRRQHVGVGRAASVVAAEPVHGATLAAGRGNFLTHPVCGSVRQATVSAPQPRVPEVRRRRAVEGAAVTRGC
jgi:hypothetical protein